MPGFRDNGVELSLPAADTDARVSVAVVDGEQAGHPALIGDDVDAVRVIAPPLLHVPAEQVADNEAALGAYSHNVGRPERRCTQPAAALRRRHTGP